MNTTAASFTLTVFDLRIWVHLGCREEEKFHPQLVSVNLEFNFSSPPSALITDDLKDTVCYLEATKAIQSLCQHKRFNLIEHLTHDIHQTASHLLADKISIISSIKVSLNKVSPPVPGVHGGVSSVYCAPPVHSKT